jgi:hypothetical protein
MEPILCLGYPCRSLEGAGLSNKWHNPVANSILANTAAVTKSRSISTSDMADAVVTHVVCSRLGSNCNRNSRRHAWHGLGDVVVCVVQRRSCSFGNNVHFRESRKPRHSLSFPSLGDHIPKTPDWTVIWTNKS